MFVGQTNHTLDDKSRLVIPAKHRSQLEGVVFAVIDLDHCISIYPKEDYLKRAEKLNVLSQFSSDARRMKRMFFGNSLELSLDNAGRVLLPKPFLNRVGIGTNVVLIGVSDHLELWDEEKYNKESLLDQEDYESLAEKLVNMER